MMNKVCEIHDKARNDLNPRLEALMNDGKITSGAYYYVYSVHQWNSYRQLSDLYDRAGKAKNFLQYLANRNMFTYTYMLKCAEEDYAEALEFIEAHEAMKNSEQV